MEKSGTGGSKVDNATSTAYLLMYVVDDIIQPVNDWFVFFFFVATLFVQEYFLEI